MLEKEEGTQLRGRKRLFFLLMFIGVLFVERAIDNDTWFLLSSGRYVAEHGLPYTEPLSMHEGFAFVMEQWLFDIGIWRLYELCGFAGLYAFSYVMSAVLLYAFYRLLKLVSGSSETAFLITLPVGLLQVPFMHQRPQLISSLFFLAEIYLLESFGQKAKGARWPVFVLLPLFSAVVVNIHSALWVMLLVLLLPYLATALLFPRVPWLQKHFLRTEGWSLKELFALFGLVLAAGFLNPYGARALIFPFYSYWNPYAAAYITELSALSLKAGGDSYFLLVILALTALYARHRLPLAQVFLAAGVGLMALSSVRCILFALYFGFLPFAYLLRDKHPFAALSRVTPRQQKALAAIGVLLAVEVLFGVAQKSRPFAEPPRMAKAVEVLQQAGLPAGGKVMASFWNGSYLEFRGYRPFIDTRIEPYLKGLNGKEDILSWYFRYDKETMDYRDFLAPFPEIRFFVTDTEDRLYENLAHDPDYRLLYDSKEDASLPPKHSFYHDKDVRVFEKIPR